MARRQVLAGVGRHLRREISNLHFGHLQILHIEVMSRSNVAPHRQRFGGETHAVVNIVKELDRRHGVRQLHAAIQLAIDDRAPVAYLT